MKPWNRAESMTDEIVSDVTSETVNIWDRIMVSPYLEKFRCWCVIDLRSWDDVSVIWEAEMVLDAVSIIRQVDMVLDDVVS